MFTFHSFHFLPFHFGVGLNHGDDLAGQARTERSNVLFVFFLILS